MTREPMSRREVIQLKMPGIEHPVYFAGDKHVTNGGMFSYLGVVWITSDVNRAKVWRHPGQAQAVVHGRLGKWERFAPTIIDPRTVAGYVDKPSRAARRNEAQRQKLARWGLV